MGHHCCVPDCSSNTRFSSSGALTYHAFPVDPKERKLWILSVRRADYKKLTVNKHTKVCSRHFREEDFIQSLGSKRRMLKKGVVPSIFNWNIEKQEVKDSSKKSETYSDELTAKDVRKPYKSADTSSNNGIKKCEDKLKLEPLDSSDIESKEMKPNIKKIKEETDKYPEDIMTPHSSYESPSKSDDSEHGSNCDLTSTNGNSPDSSTNGTSGRKTSNLNFQIGTRLEAKDLGNEIWYPVKVVEVDWDDEEVLIHFEKWSQRYDEWIPMDSSRLRPSQNPLPQTDSKNSSKILFNIGDRVMAKWSDCRKYPAKVKAVLGNDRYEVLFFDGFTKSIKGFRMTKLDRKGHSTEEQKPEQPEKEVVRPVSQPVVKNALTEGAICTKEERRERKRKINVAELFHPKKRMKLEAGSLSPRSVDSEKGKKFERRKKRTEGQCQRNDSVDNEGREEDNEPSKGKKRDLPDESSKSTTKSEKESDKEEDKWIPDGKDGYIVESAEGPRRTTVIHDKKLPDGWSKHSIQRKHGNSAGKWDVFLVSPQGRRFRSRHELRQYFEEIGESFKSEIFDFCLSSKRRSRNSDRATPIIRRRKRGPKPKLRIMSVGSDDSDHQPHTSSHKTQQQIPLHPGSAPTQRRVKTLLPKIRQLSASQSEDDSAETHVDPPSPPPPYTTTVASVPAIKVEPEMQEGEVLVGGLKIQMDGNSYRCPKESCGKNFRKENLLQMHIKHYHPEYNKFMGSTPNVADLAYARTIGESIDDLMPKSRYSSTCLVANSGPSHVEKINRFETSRKTKSGLAVGAGIGKGGGGGGGGDDSPVPDKKKIFKEKLQSSLAMKKAAKGIISDGEVRASVDDAASEVKESNEERPNINDVPEKVAASVGESTPPLPHREEKKEPQTTIKTLLPVIRSPSHSQDISATERSKIKFPSIEEGEEYVEVIDVGMKQGQTTHPITHLPASQSVTTSLQGTSVTKSLRTIRRRRLSDFHFEPLHKRRKIAAKLEVAEEVDVVDEGASSADVTSSVGTATGILGSGKSAPTYRYSRKKTPVVHLEKLNVTTDSNVHRSVSEQLRKEELINCTCGFMEEDGLMIQCDVCLCWQHGVCNNIEKESDVPEKYVCPICLNPFRQRKSMKYIHDQDWLKEGKLPSLSFRSKNETNILDREAVLKRSHDLTASLLQLQQVLHSLRVKVNIAGKLDHPKLYLWAKSWEKDVESSNITQQGCESQAESGLKDELDSHSSPNEVKNPICSSSGDHKDTEISNKTIEGNGKEQCVASADVVEHDNDGIKPETDPGLPDTGTNIEQQCVEETVITDTEITDSMKIEDKEQLEETSSELVSTLNVGTEIECSSNVEDVGNSGIGSKTDIVSENLKSAPELKREETNDNSVYEMDKSDHFNSLGVNQIKIEDSGEEQREVNTKNYDTVVEDNVQTTIELTDSDITSAPEIIVNNETSNLMEEKKNLCTYEKPLDNSKVSSQQENHNLLHADINSGSHPTDSDVILAPEIIVNDGDSKLIEESKHLCTDEKTMEDSEVSSQLESHGLLHQALTNGSQATNALNNGSLSSQLDAAGHPMLQLPICQSELMQFASTMADNLRATESRPPAPVPEPPRIPQPEAPIDPVECRLLLLDHIDHFQQQIDTRLTMFEEQVAALESQDPDAARDEAHDHYPQTKQTIQMLLRDLITVRRIAGLN